MSNHHHSSGLWLLIALPVVAAAVGLVLWLLGTPPEPSRRAPPEPTASAAATEASTPVASTPVAGPLDAGLIARQPASATTTGLRIAGRVTDATGKPAVGVQVAAEPVHQGSRRDWRRELTTRVTTDSSGQFDLAVHWSRVSVTACGTGWCGRATAISVREAGATDVHLVLERCATLAGRVLTVGEEPLAGARVEIFATDGAADGNPRWAYFTRETTTDSGGRYHLAAVPTGRLGIAADDDLHAPESRTLELEAGASITGVDFLLSPGLEIRGRVTEPDGTPVAGAQAKVWRSFEHETGKGRLDRRADSDAQGAFVLGGLDPAGYNFDLSHPDMYSEHRIMRRIAAGDHGIHIVLQRGGRIVGRVVNPEGEGVAGASVTAAAGLAGGTELADLQRVTGKQVRASSQLDGAFELRGVPPGTVGVYAQSQGLQTSTITTLDLEAGGGVSGVELVLRPGASLSGRVIDADGDPLGEVMVSAQRVRGGDRGSPARARTDTEGNFTLKGLEQEAVYRIDVRASGRSPQDPDALLAVGVAAPLTIVMLAGATLRGKVTGGSGEGIVAEVGLHQFDDAHRGLKRLHSLGTRSNHDGTYELDGLPPGVYTIAAERKGELVSEWRTVEIASGEVREGLDFVLKDGGTITGIVVDDEQRPVAGVHVQVHLVGAAGDMSPDGGAVAHMKTGVDGAFSFGGIRDAPHEVHVSPPDGYLRNSGVGRVQEARAGDALVFRLSRGLVLSGRVVDAEGQPVREFEAITYAQGADGMWSIEQARVTAPDGRFELEGIAGPVTRIDVQAKGAMVGEFDTSGCPARGRHDVGTLRLQRGASLLGKVVDGAGTGIAGAKVTAILAGGSGDDPRQYSIGRGIRTTPEGATKVEGAFEIHGLPPGRTGIRAEHPDYRSSELEITIPEAGDPDSVLLTLDRGATLLGDVRGATNQPIVGARVGAWGAGEVFQTHTGAEGQYRLESLPAGDYRVSVYVREQELPTTSGGRTLAIDTRTEMIVLPGEGEHRLDFPGYVGGRVHGTVAGGESIEGKVVRLSGSAGAFSGAVGDEGEYEVVDVPEGSYTVSVNPAYRDRIDVPAGATVRLDIALPAAGLVGHVLDADGSPAARADVMVSRGGGGAPTTTLKTRTNAEGAFEMPALQSGAWTVSAFLEGRGRSRDLTVTLEDAVQEVSLQLVAGVTLTIRARTAAGAAVPGARIACQTVGGLQLGVTRSDASGVATFAGVTADSYVLFGFASGPGNAWSDSFQVDGVSPATIELDFSAGAGRLHLRAVQGGLPAAAARVFLSHGDGLPAVDLSDGYPRTNFTANAAGELETAAFPAGEYHLRVVSADLRQTHEQNISIPAAGTLQLELTLE